MHSGFFRLRGSDKYLGGPIFEGPKEILQLGKALKFRVLFQKYAVKLKHLKIIEKSRGKMPIFLNFFKFSVGTTGKIWNITWTGYSVGLWESPRNIEKFSRNLSKL